MMGMNGIGQRQNPSLDPRAWAYGLYRRRVPVEVRLGKREVDRVSAILKKAKKRYQDLEKEADRHPDRPGIEDRLADASVKYDEAVQAMERAQAHFREVKEGYSKVWTATFNPHRNPVVDDGTLVTITPPDNETDAFRAMQGGKTQYRFSRNPSGWMEFQKRMRRSMPKVHTMAEARAQMKTIAAAWRKQKGRHNPSQSENRGTALKGALALGALVLASKFFNR